MRDFAIKKAFVITILILLCFSITIANRQRDLSLISLSIGFSDIIENRNLQNANYTVQKNITTIFESKSIPFISLSTLPSTIKKISDLGEESNDIRRKKTTSVSVNLAGGTAVIASINAGLNISSKIDITFSYFHLSAILAYNGKGISFGAKFYLPPQTNFTTYISMGVGSVWRLEENKDASLGLLTITQFGWDYTSEYGINVFGAVGPILFFVPYEKINGALLLLGLGLRF